MSYNLNIVISFITVTKNDERGLRKTLPGIASLLESNPNIEHIIFDGNSDYDVKLLAKTLSPKSTVYSETDGGIYDAMNKAIRLSNGDYFTFVNSGDRICVAAIPDVMLATQDRPDLIYGDAWEEDGNSLVLKRAYSHLRFRWGMFTHHQAMYFSRNVVLSSKLCHNTDLKIAGDWDFIIKLMRMKPKVICLPTALCVFEQGGISQRSVTLARKEVFQIRMSEFGLLSAVIHGIRQRVALGIRKLNGPLYRALRRLSLRILGY